MQNQKGYTIVELLCVMVIIVFGIGWFMNIVKLIDMSFDVFTPLLVLRFIAIVFPPLFPIGYY